MTIDNPSATLTTSIGKVEYTFRLDDKGKVIASFKFGRNPSPCKVNGIDCNGWGELKYNHNCGTPYLYCHLTVYRGSDGVGESMTANGREKIQNVVMLHFSGYLAENGESLRTECAAIRAARDYIAKRSEMDELEKKLHEAQADAGEAYHALNARALELLAENDRQEK